MATPVTLPPTGWLCACIALLTLAGGAAQAAPDDSAEPAAAEPAVRAPADEEVAAARGELSAVLNRLERRMGAGSPNAEAWKRYLQWDALSRFASGEPDAQLTNLQLSIDRLTSGEPGLELDEFQGVATAAQRLFDLLLIGTLPDAESFAATQATQLDSLLAEQPQLLDPRASFAAEQRLDFFRGAPGGGRRAERLARRFGEPNLFLDASEELLARLARRPVHNVGPVREVILGTRVTGTGDTHGSLSVATVASADSARLRVSMTGATSSQTVGVNGPAVIHSDGTTTFAGSKLVEITREDFSAARSVFDATTHTCTTGIYKKGGGFGERIVRAVAKRRVAEQKPQADRIAGDRAELRLQSEFDRQVEQELGVARRNFEREFLAPLKRRHAEPRRLDFRTSDDRLHVGMLQATRGQLAAPDAPPTAPADDLSLRLHQSAANNLASAILSGATLSRDSADEPTKLNVPVPDWAKKLARQSAQDTEQATPAEFKPWRLTFRRNRPISFRFSEDEVEVIIHAARVEAGGDEFRGWDIILLFEPAEADGRTVLARKGEVDALPTAFDPRRGGRLNSRQVGFRNNLKAQLNKQRDGEEGLPEIVELGPIELRDGRGELTANRLSSTAGWLALTWLAH
ncbi:hypothetical protein KOR34_20210 [Posidoniimonas corsicana]|uniref:Uncharacterized protein n=1 Tax=Posidoniimonas corsicana TaxID=1938618 RepID=A0A5C5VEK0_9BACT|nr:hypothetical protein KOR34_20210 [Posidoniimonas corsicana]